MDRYDVGEFAGLGLLVAFCWFLWPPLILAAAGVAVLVEANLRSRGRAPVRSARPLDRIGKAAKAARAAWAAGNAAA